MIRAVELGANVIDTAANYRFQRSERLIGAALAELREREFAREELLICTKGGYLPFDGAPPRDVRQYVEQTFIRTGIAGWGDIAGGAHCMTPGYLENQLAQSLRNMNLDCVDVYYVHNPESQLGVSHRTSSGSVCAPLSSFWKKSPVTDESKVTAWRRGVAFGSIRMRVNITRWRRWP